MARRLPVGPFLYAIVDAERLGARPAGDAAEALARGGAAVVQLRAKRVPDRRLFELAREARDGAGRGGALFVVNDRPDIALLLGAGVHLGQDDLPPAEARLLLGADAVIGRSTHSLAQLEEAVREPVDYVALGPVFATATKGDAEAVVGLAMVRAARALTQLPLVAIGGIDRERAPQVVAAGADGLAVISALLDEADLARAAREFLAGMRR